MKGKKEALKIVSEKLHDVPWVIFSGMAVEIYSHGERKANDIDIIVNGKKAIDEVGRRFNVKPILETKIKSHVHIINDYCVETKIAGTDVEFVGEKEAIMINGVRYSSTKNKDILFKTMNKVRYLGEEVFVVSIEELLVQKILFNRSGEWQDKEDVSLILKYQKVDLEKLKISLKRWGVSEEQQKRVFFRFGLKRID